MKRTDVISLVAAILERANIRELWIIYHFVVNYVH